MSRTRRRKNVRTPEDYGYKTYFEKYLREKEGNRWYCWEPDDEIRNSVQFKKICEFAYHRDTRSAYGWNGNAPAWYRRGCNRVARAKETHEVKRILKKGDFEEYEFNPRKSDAGYHYW
jgi:hypothetical protein